MMFVAEKSKISHIDMTAGARLETVITLPDDSYVNAVDGDAANEMIYYTDLRYSRIMKVNYNGSQNMPVSYYSEFEAWLWWVSVQSNPAINNTHNSMQIFT